MTTILIVDDSPVDQRLAGGLVESVGMRPFFAANGREALGVVEEAAPDIVLTDMQMPELDGLELVQELKSRKPSLPVVLMTAFGSEELAVAALKNGAASYVPKRNLARELTSTLDVVLGMVRFRRQRSHVLSSLEETQSRFQLDNDWTHIQPLIEHFQHQLREANFCGEGDLVRVGTALHEALHNAIEHGNLELDSADREGSTGEYVAKAAQRREVPPYCERQVRVVSHMNRECVTYSIEDQGPGFDTGNLPDPTDPANLEKQSGRGLFLIRVFMDDVSFNPTGNRITMSKRRSR